MEYRLVPVDGENDCGSSSSNTNNASKTVFIPEEYIVKKPYQKLKKHLLDNGCSRTQSGEFSYNGRTIKGSNFNDILQFLAGCGDKPNHTLRRIKLILLKIKTPKRLISKKALKEMKI